MSDMNAHTQQETPPQVILLPEVFADFARMDNIPGLGVALLLGTDERRPELVAMLGKPVVFRYPREVEADGYIVRREEYGEGFLYGVLTSSIRDISPPD
ncbi:MAG TPA: hypothetical protein VKQ36_00925 [Ktedonobacterales bacterium]|nr:hypothetical protein [Ktedonobacterales bacterium]